ncbi:rab-like protein 6 [Choloepus didactylus]|uniref:rab-like protein 6 n=1 Tax=Choloepus didactylus TaxID=27675 RepID=UPI00189DF9E6|nr:rab-like protein 6 [Choloepus didactylus]
MFSALKKLVGSEQAPVRDKNIPAGLQSMNQALQRRFAKGVQYNMKIVIRGDRNTGKSALWHRLQGKKFVEEYIPTQEIQVTSIHWNYKTTDDIVKVEVWDVVDKGKCKKRGDGLKMENDPQEAESEMALDAEFLDVYKNCNGVVMMFDITKQWTFNYILRELPKVPTHVPVCVLGNYRDMGEHRVILPEDVRDCIERLDRPPGSSYFRYAESSMKNSFGLKYLHKFFNIPFLQLQRETLLRQLETNQLDIDATLEELSVQQETEDQNYELFLEVMEARSRSHTSPLAANGQSPASGSQSPIVPPSATSTGSSSPSTPQPAPQQLLTTPSACPTPPAEVPLPAPPAPRRSIISRLFGTASAAEVAPSLPEPTLGAEAPAKVQSVEDFVPEGGMDHSFLEDTAPLEAAQRAGTKALQHDSDSDGEAVGGNPMVAGLQDDVDSADEPRGRSLLPAGPVPSRNITLSSEEEVEEGAGHPKLSNPASQPCSEAETKRSSRKTKPPGEVAPTKASEPQQPGSFSAGSGLERCSGPQPPFKAPTATPHTRGPSLRHAESKEGQVSSDSDHEGPIAAQMLSFVMDDPDFESEESDTPRRAVEFPVREDPSDISDEDPTPARLPPPLQPSVHSFKLKNDTDLFGLGPENPGHKDSSNEDKEGKPPSKEKKKKKKKKEGKEVDEKAAKRKSKHRTGKGEKTQRKQQPRSQEDAVDELEAFLGSAAPGSGHRGGGDYEAL